MLQSFQIKSFEQYQDDILEFYEEYNARFGRPPFINSLVTIDDDEFDTLKDKFESDAAIFIGEYRGDLDE